MQAHIEKARKGLSYDRDVFFRCVEGSNDTIMLTDKQGVIQYVNAAWQKVYGYSWEEIQGKTPATLRSKYQDKDFYAHMWSQILDPHQGYWKGELINLAKDGHEVPVFLTITPFANEKGETVGYMGIAVDITEQKKLQAQVLHQDRLASIGLIAAGLAHEIGNPLGVIRGRAEYLSMLIANTESVKNNVDIIVKQIDRISKLIYSLLHFSRTSESPKVTKISVHPIVEEVLALFSKQAEEKNISFINSIDKNILVDADPSKLEQVFLNLIINSVQAIEDSLKDGIKNNHKIEVSSYENGNRWAFTVSDTGRGISEANLAQIFKPFYTTKESGVGTGLGLAICDQIIRSWEGSIDVKSTLGQGTTFTIFLPKPKT